MHKILQLRTADEMSDRVGANLRAKSKVTSIVARDYPWPAAAICKMAGVKKEFALVETYMWRNNTLHAGAVAAALCEFWPVLWVGNELRNDQAATMSLLERDPRPEVVMIMSRGEPDQVLKSMRDTRMSKTCSNYEAELFLTDMTRARHSLEPRGASVVRCELHDVHTVVLKELKNA